LLQVGVLDAIDDEDAGPVLLLAEEAIDLLA